VVGAAAGAVVVGATGAAVVVVVTSVGSAVVPADRASSPRAVVSGPASALTVTTRPSGELCVTATESAPANVSAEAPRRVARNLLLERCEAAMFRGIDRHRANP
jgi:hypothetical protein